MAPFRFPLFRGSEISPNIVCCCRKAQGFQLNEQNWLACRYFWVKCASVASVRKMHPCSNATCSKRAQQVHFGASIPKPWFLGTFGRQSPEAHALQKGTWCTKFEQELQFCTKSPMHKRVVVHGLVADKHHHHTWNLCCAIEWTTLTTHAIVAWSLVQAVPTNVPYSWIAYSSCETAGLMKTYRRSKGRIIMVKTNYLPFIYLPVLNLGTVWELCPDEPPSRINHPIA